MRLRADIWVAAYIRTVEVQGGYATLRRRGSPEAGAIFIVVDRLDGRVALYAPGPADDLLGERRFVRAYEGEGIAAVEINQRLERELKRDPDIWIVDVERRDGESGLTLVDA